MSDKFAIVIVVIFLKNGVIPGGRGEPFPGGRGAVSRGKWSFLKIKNRKKER